MPPSNGAAQYGAALVPSQALVHWLGKSAAGHATQYIWVAGLELVECRKCDKTLIHYKYDHL